MLKEKIATLLDQNEAEHIVIMDMSNTPIITDTFLICTANSKTHMASLRDRIIDFFSSIDKTVLYYDKGKEYDWLIVDASEIVIHIFTKKGREFYALEKLWINAKQKEWIPASSISKP